MHTYGNRKTFISAAALLGIILAVYYPIAANAGKFINGSLDDVYAILWQLWWFKHSLIDLHANPSFSPFVESPFGVAVTHATIINHLIALPLTWAWGAVVSYNIMILFSFFFSALGMYLLVFELTGSHLASFFSGTAYAFSPFHTVFSASGGMDAAQIQYMPFTLLFLIRFDKYRSRSDLYLFVLSLLLCVLSFGYYAALTALMLAIYIIYRKAQPLFTPILKAGSAGPIKTATYFSLLYIVFVFAYNAFEEIESIIGLALLLALPVAGFIAVKRFEVDLSEIKRIASAVTPAQRKLLITVAVLFVSAVLFFLLPVFGAASRSISSSYLVPAYSYFVPAVDHQVLGKLIPAGLTPAPDPFVGKMVYTGLILPALSTISLFGCAANEEERSNKNFFILLLIAGVMLAFPPVVKIGEFSLYGPIYFFHKVIPPFVDVRRVIVIILIPLCVLAGLGLSHIFSNLKSRAVKALIFAFSFILVSIEFYPNIEVKDMSALPSAYNWFAGASGDFAVAEYPLTSIYDLKRYESFYGQTVHGKRLVNPFGALGHEPSASNNALKPFIERGGPANEIFVNTENASGALAFLGVRYAVVRTDKLGYVPAIEKNKGFTEAARFNDSVVYEIDAKPAGAYITLSGFLKGSYFRNYSQKTEGGFEIRNPFVRAKDVLFQGKNWAWLEKEGAIKITNLKSDEAGYALTFHARSLAERAKLMVIADKETYEFEVSAEPKEISIKGIRLGPSGALVLKLVSDESSSRFGKDLLDQGNNDNGGAFVTIGISDARLTETAPESRNRSKKPEMTEGLFGEDI